MGYAVGALLLDKAVDIGKKWRNGEKRSRRLGIGKVRRGKERESERELVREYEMVREKEMYILMAWVKTEWPQEEFQQQIRGFQWKRTWLALREKGTEKS